MVALAAGFWIAAPALPAVAKEGTVPPAASSAATADVSAQKVKRARKPAARRIATAPVAASAPYYQQCFLFLCTSNGRPFHWLVLGVAY
jgi:hypothetical protein